jgi:ATP-binding cassette subfamily B multidrug efflux pump
VVGEHDKLRSGAGVLGSLRLVLAFLWRYGRRYWWQYAIGFAALFATNWAVVRIPTLIGDILNELERAGVGTKMTPELAARMQAAVDPVSNLALELMVWAIALIGVRTISRVLFFNPGREIQYRLGLDLFAHLLTLQRPFFGRRKVGELISVATNDTQSVRLLVGFAGLQVLNVAVAIPMHLYQMLRTDWVLTLWCVSPVLFGAIYMRWTVHRFYALIRGSMEKLAALSDRILESFAGVATVRAHVAEDAAVERFQKYNRDYLDLQLEVASLRAFSMPVLAFTGYLGTGIVLWIGGNRVVADQLAVGSLATFTALLVSLVGVLTSLAWVLTAVSRGTVSLERVHELLDTRPELPEVEREHVFSAAPRLELRDLTFTYPGREQPALRGISAVVEPGRTLGIFGRTGSGKTTLIDLLARVYTPPPGTVSLDGYDARTLELASLRAGAAVVPQTPFLFSTTLRDNIRLRDERIGHIAADDAEVASPRMFRRRAERTRAPAREVEPDPRLDAVIEAACLGPDVRALPEGLDTIVGERGVMLSGGQRQRTAFARALYREPKLLLLDDVLSAVDQTTETKLVAAIRSASAGSSSPTTVIVSHRTSVLEHADEILVLDRGEVVERGTHAQLIARKGIYAAAHEHQRQEGEASRG